MFAQSGKGFSRARSHHQVTWPHEECHICGLRDTRLRTNRQTNEGTRNKEKRKTRRHKKYCWSFRSAATHKNRNRNKTQPSKRKSRHRKPTQERSIRASSLTRGTPFCGKVVMSICTLSRGLINHIRPTPYFKTQKKDINRAAVLKMPILKSKYPDRVIPDNQGCYEFVFSGVEDVKDKIAVVSIRSLQCHFCWIRTSMSFSAPYEKIKTPFSVCSQDVICRIEASGQETFTLPQIRTSERKEIFMKSWSHGRIRWSQTEPAFDTCVGYVDKKKKILNWIPSRRGVLCPVDNWRPLLHRNHKNSWLGSPVLNVFLVADWQCDRRRTHLRGFGWKSEETGQRTVWKRNQKRRCCVSYGWQICFGNCGHIFSVEGGGNFDSMQTVSYTG